MRAILICMTLGNLEIPNSKKQISENLEEKESNTWTEEDYAVLIGNIEILKNTNNLKENPEKYQEKAKETYKDTKKYFEDHGYAFTEDVTSLYNEYIQNNTPKVVRREDPSKIINLASGQPILIHFDPDVVGDRGDKYANCALWPHGSVSKTSGIANAFLEGRGMAGPIAMVAIYTNNPDHMEISEPENKMLEVGTISRDNVKILSGTIEQEDLESIILRVQAKFFDEKEMTETERKLFREGKLLQIFRGFNKK